MTENDDTSPFGANFAEGALLFTLKKSRKTSEPDVGDFHLRLSGQKLPAGARPVALLSPEGTMEVLSLLDAPTPAEKEEALTWLQRTIKESIRQFVRDLEAIEVPHLSPMGEQALLDLVGDTHPLVLRHVAARRLRESYGGAEAVRNFRKVTPITDEFISAVGRWIRPGTSTRDQVFFAQAVPQWAQLWMSRVEPQRFQAAIDAV